MEYLGVVNSVVCLNLCGYNEVYPLSNTGDAIFVSHTRKMVLVDGVVSLWRRWFDDRES